MIKGDNDHMRIVYLTGQLAALDFLMLSMMSAADEVFEEAYRIDTSDLERLPLTTSEPFFRKEPIISG